MVRLYGVGAIQFDHNGGLYRPVDGVLDVPADLVPRAMQFGFSPAPPDPAAAPSAPEAPVPVAATPDPAPSAPPKPRRGG